MKMFPTALSFAVAAGMGGLIFWTNTNFCKPNEEKAAIYAEGKPVSIEQTIMGEARLPILGRQEMSEENRLHIFANYIESFEGRKNRVYDPNPNDDVYEPTIGVGHHLQTDSRRKFARILPEVDYDGLMDGKTKLNDVQIDRLLREDITEKIAKARRQVTNFNSYPLDVQTAITYMAFRSELFKSPKMVCKLNAGDIRGAAIEYLDNSPEYRNAIDKGMGGIRRLREENQRRLLEYANILGQ